MRRVFAAIGAAGTPPKGMPKLKVNCGSGINSVIISPLALSFFSKELCENVRLTK